MRGYSFSAGATLTAAPRTDGLVAETLSGRAAPVELKSFLGGQIGQSHNWLKQQLRGNTHFRFYDRWQVDGHIEEVARTLLNTEAISRWWPQLACLKVSHSGDHVGAGRTFVARASGFLPYKLAIDFRVMRVRFPEEFSVELTGDLCGYGGGRLRQAGPRVDIDFNLTVRVTRPILHVLSLVARPALCAQHRWVMQQGERGLRKTMRSRERIGADA
jgi:hypothetical protein